MIKHFAGFMIFSLIVGTSAVIGNLFIRVPATSSVQVADSGDKISRKKRKKRCRRNSANQFDGSSVTVVMHRAAIDPETRVLEADIKLKGSNLEPGDLALHFYVSDKYGTRYLATEFVAFGPEFSTPAFEADTLGPESLELSFEWLNRLNSHENLFVMADFAGNRDSYQKSPPSFDPLKATAIRVGPTGHGHGAGTSRF